MKIKNIDMVMQAMEKIELLQTHIKNIERAASDVCNFGRQGEKVDFGTLHNSLMALELAAWRNLSMWGLTLDDAERDRVKAAVHARFLNEHMGVGHWLNDGVSGRAWLVADEAEFRAMAKQAFGPKGE